MPRRKKHPNKTIEEAIRHAEAMGWRYKKIGQSAHAWGRLLCPLNTPEGCSLSVWSTPKNAAAHAKQILTRVKQCQHQQEKSDE